MAQSFLPDSSRNPLLTNIEDRLPAYGFYVQLKTSRLGMRFGLHSVLRNARRHDPDLHRVAIELFGRASTYD
jgi:hypothetical protein